MRKQVPQLWSSEPLEPAHLGAYILEQRHECKVVARLLLVKGSNNVLAHGCYEEVGLGSLDHGDAHVVDLKVQLAVEFGHEFASGRQLNQHSHCSQVDAGLLLVRKWLHEVLDQTAQKTPRVVTRHEQVHEVGVQRKQLKYQRNQLLVEVGLPLVFGQHAVVAVHVVLQKLNHEAGDFF